MTRETHGSRARTLAVLYPAFALTGILHSIGGPLMPSIAASFNLRDSQSGLLFFLYFGGSSVGAILCRWNYARSMAIGFAGAAACCLGVAVAGPVTLPIVFFLLGIGVGVPMSAISLYVGRSFPERCAPLLTFLNFVWSAGALVAPLIAARILLRHTYRSAYEWMAVPSLIAAIACGALLKDAPEPSHAQRGSVQANSLALIAAFALAAFLQVGVENTSTAWLSTYVMREAGIGAALAAAATSIYWIGFLASRGVCSAVLLRARTRIVFLFAVGLALVASLMLAVEPSPAGNQAAMFMLGVGLAPIYPLLIAEFLARANHTSEARWVMATAGFGGSVTPWLAGWISSRTGSLRMGMLTIPASIALMVVLLPVLRGPRHAGE
ncbi:MAG TPA: MFS transporter [Terracidiphilus sp.]|nr:MFS transporter [Terracidiphilus sp.]